MAHAEIHEVLPVDLDRLWRAITRYKDYSQFVDGCTSVEMHRTSETSARAEYKISLIKDISYVLDHQEDKAQGRMSWTLVSSDFLKKNSGRWQLTAAGPDKTDVRYELEIEFKIPVPSLILNRLVKGSLPAMVRNFEKRAKELPSHDVL